MTSSHNTHRSPLSDGALTGRLLLITGAFLVVAAAIAFDAWLFLKAVTG